MGPASPCWDSLPSAPPLELRHLRGPSQAPGPPDGPTLTPHPYLLALPACRFLSAGRADGLIIPHLCLCCPVPSLYPWSSAPSTVNFPPSPHTFWLPAPALEEEVLSLQTEAPPAYDPPSPTAGLPLATAPAWHCPAPFPSPGALWVSQPMGIPGHSCSLWGYSRGPMAPLTNGG